MNSWIKNSKNSPALNIAFTVIDITLFMKNNSFEQTRYCNTVIIYILIYLFQHS